MQKEITYIDDKTFGKLTKKQKLQLPMQSDFEDIDVNKALFIQTTRKMSGYTLAAIFLQNDNGWFRGSDYDCFNFTNPHYMLRGDFEYGGMVFFLGDNSKNNYVYGYGHSLMCKDGEQYKSLMEFRAKQK